MSDIEVVGFFLICDSLVFGVTAEEKVNGSINYNVVGLQAQLSTQEITKVL